MKLINYMPPFLKNVREFNRIFNAEDIEIDKLKEEIDNMLKEVIVRTAESYGIERYEKIYDITNPPETLEARRMQILFKMNNRVPYSYKWLINTLNEAIGEKNYTITTDFNNYKLNIEIDLTYTEAAEILKRDLVKQMPANIELDYRLKTSGNCYCGAVLVQKTYMFLKATVDKEIYTETTKLNPKFAGSMQVQEYLDIKECER